jgi:hypothetical protein
MNLDEDAMVAAADLVGRTGARGLQVGYLHENAPADQADWYAYVQYQGARIMVEHQVGPVEALDALANRLLTGARCQHCRGLVALSPFGALAFDSMMADGSTWTAAEAAKTTQCLWRRVGRRWIRGCEPK